MGVTREETLVASRLGSMHKSGACKSLMALYIVFSTLLGIRPLIATSACNATQTNLKGGCRPWFLLVGVDRSRAQWIGHPLRVTLILREGKRDGGQGERNRNEV